MNPLMWLIRKLLLTKEIISKEGVVHFRRYRLLSTPWFNLYIHQILHSDMEKHFHDHPWGFYSLILFGAYREYASYPPSYFAIHSTLFQAGNVAQHRREDAHHITLITPTVWSFVLTTGRKHDWGYRTQHGWIDHQEYRKMKNEGKI